MKRNIMIAACLMAAAASGAQNINSLAVEIAGGNPAVAAATLSGRAEVESLKGQNVLPDPTVELEQLWGAGDYGNKFTVGVSQEFEFPTVYKLRNDAADARGRALSNLERATLVDKALQAKLAILEIIYCRESLAALKRVTDNLDALQARSDRAMRGGEINVIDMRKMQIERIGVEQRIDELNRRIAELYAEVSGIGGGRDFAKSLDAMTSYPAEPFLDEARYLKMADCDPMLEYNDAMASSRTAELRSLKAERLPRISLGAAYNYEGGNTFAGVRLGVSLPLYSSKHRTNAINLERESLLAENIVLRNDADASVKSLYASAVKLREAIDKYTPAIDDSTTTALLLKALDGGQITVLQYLQEVNYFINAELSLDELRYNYMTTLARLNRLDLLTQ